MAALENNMKKEVQVWCDGCYDMVHFGHANQLRQAKKMGTYLVVGVHNDHDISVHKGPPVFNEQERYRMVRGIKWVDKVVENAPYVTTVDYLNKYNCDFCVHGNDITLTADGKDTYAEVKSLGRYRECKRTPGVSTTDLVGRMLLLTRSHHNDLEMNKLEHCERARTLSTVRDEKSLIASLPLLSNKENLGPTRRNKHYRLHFVKEKTKKFVQDSGAHSPWTRISRFLPSTQTISEFSEGRSPLPTDRIVYVCGSFDLFHIGHLCFLEEARKLGDYLIVGIYNDQIVNEFHGQNYPIMTLHERVLSVLAYKPVNEVVIDAPFIISQELIDRFRIQVVVQGAHIKHHKIIEKLDCYDLPKKLGIYRTVDSKNDMTTEKIIKRIINNKIQFEKRNMQKEKKEIASYNALQKLKKTKEGQNLTNQIISLSLS